MKSISSYKKHTKHIEKTHIYIYILFPIEFLTTARFHNSTKGLGAKIYIPNGRIPFESGLGKKSSSPAFGSVIIQVQDKWEVELLNMEDFGDKQLSLF